MASLKRVTHKNGRIVYRIAISLGYDKQGHKLVKNFTCYVDQSIPPRQQEKEALRYAMEMEDKLKYGHGACEKNLSFEDFAYKWLDDTKESLAHGTYVGYEQLLRSKILPYFRAYKMNCVGTSDIEAFYRTLAGEYSPGTIKRYANVLNGIFGTAKRWNLISENPCRNARKPFRMQDTHKLRYFTPKQSLVFLRSLDLSYEVKYQGHPRVRRDGSVCRIGAYTKRYQVPIQYRVFYTLSIFCGFRKGETLALHWDDIDLDKKEISITKAIGRTEHGFDYKEPKNSMSVRKVPFPDTVAPLLKEYRKKYDQIRNSLGEDWEGEGTLFIRPDGRRMGEATTYQYFLGHLKRYNQWVEEHPKQAALEGLTELPFIPLHGLRHSCATLLNYLEVNIIDISKYLGHASCSTTMNIYAHSFEEQKRVAVDKLNDYVRNGIQHEVKK